MPIASIAQRSPLAENTRSIKLCSARSRLKI